MNDFKDVFFFQAIINPQGFISDIGGKALQEAEVEPELLIGQQFSDIIFWQHNEFTPAAIANSVKIASEGKPFELETSFRVNAGKISILKANFVPRFDQLNQVTSIIIWAIDVTEYTKEIDFQKKRSERFLFSAESAEVGLWFWDLAKDELFTTPRCNELYGFPADEILTFDKFNEVIHPDDHSNVEQALNDSHTNLTDYQIEYRVVLGDGGLHWLTVRGKTFKEEDSLIMMGSVRDITHRKVADRRLQQLVVIEKIARGNVEEANRAKDHFLAIVSHELRSPLNSILGWTKILLGKEVDKKTQQNALETIKRSAEFQEKLISDLVDSTKIISGKMNFSIRPLPLKGLINGLYDSHKPLAEEKNIKFVLKPVPEIKVSGDAGRLQQVFTNLITNSIKFTPPEGEITIEVREEKSQVVFTITDTGCGIPDADLSSIFKQYFQVEGAGQQGGLGLGLSIVKAIVERLGGSVSVANNNNGSGCSFEVRLPIYRDQNLDNLKESVADKKSNDPLKNIDILIVEDNEDSREVLHFYLNQMGAQVFSVNSAREGLNHLASSEKLPQVIISDISMPEEDGYSFIRKVRELPPGKGREIPAIAMTALASAYDRKKSIDAGFQSHHTKPFEPDELVNDILETLK